MYLVEPTVENLIYAINDHRSATHKVLYEETAPVMECIQFQPVEIVKRQYMKPLYSIEDIAGMLNCDAEEVQHLMEQAKKADEVESEPQNFLELINDKLSSIGTYRTDFAKYVGIDPPRIYRVLDGKQPITLEQAEKMIRFFADANNPLPYSAQALVDSFKGHSEEYNTLTPYGEKVLRVLKTVGVPQAMAAKIMGYAGIPPFMNALHGVYNVLPERKKLLKEFLLSLNYDFEKEVWLSKLVKDETNPVNEHQSKKNAFETLKDYLAESHVSIKQFSKEIGLSRVTVQEGLRGIIKFTIPMAQKIVDWCVKRGADNLFTADDLVRFSNRKFKKTWTLTKFGEKVETARLLVGCTYDELGRAIGYHGPAGYSLKRLLCGISKAPDERFQAINDFFEKHGVDLEKGEWLPKPVEKKQAKAAITEAIKDTHIWLTSIRTEDGVRLEPPYLVGKPAQDDCKVVMNVGPTSNDAQIHPLRLTIPEAEWLVDTLTGTIASARLQQKITLKARLKALEER